MSCRNSQEDAVEVAVLLDTLHHVLQHLGADAKVAVGCQAAQRHDVQLALAVDDVHPAAHGAHHDIVKVGCPGGHQVMSDRRLGRLFKYPMHRLSG